MYPMKQKDICDYDPRCIMSSGLMFDDIIMGIIKNNKFPHPLQRLVTTSFICTGGHFKNFTEKMNLRVSINAIYTFAFKKE